ncbi:diacylglycerol kinase family protein [Mesobacillus zeae]|uniref:Diacylglycerol kinase family protein n=1 Tax=Mesobacillus zeae TaxID=1917180 RepID=A0A398B4Q8_9BACI|nr:diacylglycerol kinase family protein [Mesobacillus zeae]RID83808.1 diacylglycerol kinase family protein [Mesobacillus zeae]
MNMDSRGDQEEKSHSLHVTFGFALSGIVSAVRNERNMKIHLFISVMVVVLGAVLTLTRLEWLFILLAIGGMLAAEMMNTAVERTVDLCTKEIHPLAKQAKDIAAGAVLIYAIMCVMIGLIIFIPKISRLIHL